jgi:hypothetical protein
VLNASSGSRTAGRSDHIGGLNFGGSIDKSCHRVQHLGIGIGVIRFRIVLVFPQTDCAVLVSMTISIWFLFRQKPTSFAEAVRDRNLIVACLTAYTLFFCTFTAYGRLCQGLKTALAPRYVIYLEPAVLGVYFFLLTVRSAPTRKALLSGFSIGVIAASFYLDRTGMWTSRHIKEGWKTCYLQTQDIETCNQVTGVAIYPQTENLGKKLEFLKKRRLNLFLDQQVPYLGGHSTIVLDKMGTHDDFGNRMGTKPFPPMITQLSVVRSRPVNPAVTLNGKIAQQRFFGSISFMSHCPGDCLSSTTFQCSWAKPNPTSLPVNCVKELIVEVGLQKAQTPRNSYSACLLHGP